jgi:Fe-S cluster biogenesis protein NfuA
MRIPTAVYAEITPNPAVMKFVADRLLIPDGRQAEFRSKRAAACAPLAEELFNFPFVTNVFISGPFVSVTKDASLGWEMIVQQLREYIRDWLMEHEHAVDAEALEVYLAGEGAPSADPVGSAAPAPVPGFIAEADIVPTPLDDEIRHLLDEYVRPAVEQDGGAIDFRAFRDGIVYVHLKGACSGCPSSMQTLKGGIEQLLCAKLPDVREVVAAGV